MTALVEHKCSPEQRTGNVQGQNGARMPLIAAEALSVIGEEYRYGQLTILHARAGQTCLCSTRWGMHRELASLSQCCYPTVRTLAAVNNRSPS